MARAIVFASSDRTRAECRLRCSDRASRSGCGCCAVGGRARSITTALAKQTYLLTTATVPIFEPSTLASLSAATDDSRAAVYSTATRRNDATLIVTRGYERALLAQAIVASRAVTVTYQQRHVDDESDRVRVGDAPRYQLFESQAALAQARQALEDATADRDEAISDLQFTLDFAVAPGLQLADILSPLALTGDLTSFASRALVSRPEVLAAGANVAAARALLTAARAQYLPTIAATAQTYNGHSNPQLGASGYQVGVTAALPVIDSGSRSAAVHEADAGVRRAQAALEQAQLSAQRDVANAWREYQAAQHNLETAHVQAISASEELRISLLRERGGKGIALETLSALSDDAVARENTLRATARLNDAIAAVHRAAGDATI